VLVLPLEIHHDGSTKAASEVSDPMDELHPIENIGFDSDHGSKGENTPKQTNVRGESFTESTSWSHDNEELVALPSPIVEKKTFHEVSPEPEAMEEASAQIWNELGFADQDGFSSTSFAVGSASIGHFQMQVSRVVGFIVSEKINHEMFAKALLEDLLKQPLQPQQSISAEFLQKVEGLAASYKILEKYAANMTDVLIKMARKADLKLQTTSAAALLQREMEGANKSSSFIVVLGDIYQFIRTAQEASTKPAIKDGPSDKWVAPSSFERKTAKYWWVAAIQTVCFVSFSFLFYYSSQPTANTIDPSLIFQDCTWTND